jgi:hypothetical protein
MSKFDPPLNNERAKRPGFHAKRKRKGDTRPRLETGGLDKGEMMVTVQPKSGSQNGGQ